MEGLQDALKALRYTRKRLDSTDTRFARSNYNVALAYHGMSALDSARVHIRQAYDLMVPNLSYDPDFAEVCELYGRIETELGYHLSADRLLSSARDIKFQLYGRESYDYMRSLYYSAELEMARERWDRMVNIVEEALEIHENHFTKNRDYARFANFLGLIYMNNQLYDQSARNFYRALSVYDETDQEKDFTYGHVNNNLGLIYYYRSDFENAALHFEQAESIYQVLMEGYSENYMMLLNNLASLYFSWKKPELTQKAYLKLKKYLDSYPDKRDINYIQAVENMANYHAEVGEFQTSVEYYRWTIEIRQSMQPVDSLGLARIMVSLATVYFDGSRPDLAAETAVSSYLILKELLPADDPELDTLLRYIGEACYLDQQYEKALYYQHQARDLE